MKTKYPFCMTKQQIKQEYKISGQQVNILFGLKSSQRNVRIPTSKVIKTLSILEEQKCH